MKRISFFKCEAEHPLESCFIFYSPHYNANAVPKMKLLENNPENAGTQGKADMQAKMDKKIAGEKIHQQMLEKHGSQTGGQGGGKRKKYWYIKKNHPR